MVFATNAVCFCWMQMAATSGCHASEKMQDCCCNQEAEVDDQAPERDLAVLPSVLQMLEIDLVVSVVDETSFSIPQKTLSVSRCDRTNLLRSPPDLYVLHATYLI
jgi:hypothetical protein